MTLEVPEEFAAVASRAAADRSTPDVDLLIGPNATSVEVASPPNAGRTPGHARAASAAVGGPLTGVATTLKIVLYISATGVALVGLTNAAYAFWSNEILNGGWGPSYSTIDLTNGLEALGTWMYVLGLVSGAVFWMIWQYRVANRAVAAASGGSTYAPHAIWFWLVPIANLFVPYQAITSYFRIGTRRSVTPSVFRWWWGLWLVGSLFWVIGLEIQSRAIWLEDEVPGYGFALLGGGLLAVAAYLAVLVVRTTTAAFSD